MGPDFKAWISKTVSAFQGWWGAELTLVSLLHLSSGGRQLPFQTDGKRKGQRCLWRRTESRALFPEAGRKRWGFPTEAQDGTQDKWRQAWWGQGQGRSSESCPLGIYVSRNLSLALVSAMWAGAFLSGAWSSLRPQFLGEDGEHIRCSCSHY